MECIVIFQCFLHGVPSLNDLFVQWLLCNCNGQTLAQKRYCQGIEMKEAGADDVFCDYRIVWHGHCCQSMVSIQDFGNSEFKEDKDLSPGSMFSGLRAESGTEIGQNTRI